MWTLLLAQQPADPSQKVFCTFHIGRYPVTVSQFWEFLLDSGLRPVNEAIRSGKDDHPATAVDWSGALAYARWHGFTLPSEAEWEKAARGTDGREYPWGNGWRSGLANTREFHSGWRRVLRSRALQTTVVGRFSPDGDSPYGCSDMAGNVWEWTRSSYEKYPYNKEDGREDLNAPEEAPRVLRGGSFASELRSARCAYRDHRHPRFALTNDGFRVCAPIYSEL